MREAPRFEDAHGGRAGSGAEPDLRLSAVGRGQHDARVDQRGGADDLAGLVLERHQRREDAARGGAAVICGAVNGRRLESLAARFAGRSAGTGEGRAERAGGNRRPEKKDAKTNRTGRP
jgi:hypothetical protein